MSRNIKENALLNEFARLKEKLNDTMTVQRRMEIINDFVNTIEHMFRHYTHMIKVVNNGMANAFIFVSFIFENKLCGEIIIIEEGNVTVV